MTQNDEILNLITSLLNKGGLPYEKVEVLHLDQAEAVSPVYNICSKQLKYRDDFVKSLTHVVKMILKSQDKSTDFFLDINEHFFKRLSELQKASQILAQRALSLKTDVELKPMPAKERFVIHALLQNYNENIATQSEGEGSQRHVVIKYVGN